MEVQGWRASSSSRQMASVVTSYFPSDKMSLILFAIEEGEGSCKDLRRPRLGRERPPASSSSNEPKCGVVGLGPVGKGGVMAVEARGEVRVILAGVCWFASARALKGGLHPLCSGLDDRHLAAAASGDTAFKSLEGLEGSLARSSDGFRSCRMFEGVGMGRRSAAVLLSTVREAIWVIRVSSWLSCLKGRLDGLQGSVDCHCSITWREV